MDERPQIKICGLTVAGEAAACAALGADAIGLVFHPASPRNVTLDQAAAITSALPGQTGTVGVFVDPDWELLQAAVRQCGLSGVQLHGTESQIQIDRLRAHFDGSIVKALFATREPFFSAAASYSVTAFLVECGRGVLPGGNALTWEWGDAAQVVQSHPTVLAGGLAADNVAQAIAACLPDAVDASSGLEAAPGRKDLHKVERFIAAVRQTAGHYAAAGRRPRPVFMGRQQHNAWRPQERI